jgi:hypothetical protein
MAAEKDPVITWPKVVAATGASVAGFLVATRLGVLGTVLGVAIISIVASVASALLEDSLQRGRSRVAARRQQPTEQPRDTFYDTWDLPTVTPGLPGESRPVTAAPPAAQEPTEEAATPEPAGTAPLDDHTRTMPVVAADTTSVAPHVPDDEAAGTAADRRLSWRSKRIWVPALVVFGFAMGAVLVAYLTGQTPPRQPIDEPSPTVIETVTVTPTASPSPTATPTPTPTSPPTPTPTETAGPTEQATPAATTEPGAGGAGAAP